LGLIEVEVKGLKFKVDDTLRYTETDEWVRVEDGVARVGVTDYAQKELKDVIGVELPEVGSRVKRGERAATIESIKATADVYSPVTGEIVEVNERLLEEPELINKDPYGEGWIFAVKIEDRGEVESLLDYKAYVESVRKRKEKG
jgi:glycine cleavage system H protein